MYAKRHIHTNDTNQQVSRALRLLELLNSVEGTIITANEARSVLSATDEELDESIELISTLADRQGGSRAICFRDHDDIVLQGSAAHMLPLRLSVSEGMVLAHLLDVLTLPTDARTRITNALVPPACMTISSSSLSTTTTYGVWFSHINDALRENKRIVIQYRSQNDTEAHERTLEPLGFTTSQGVTYLVAHDINHPDTRTYRLDRIVDINVTNMPCEQVVTTQRPATHAPYVHPVTSNQVSDNLFSFDKAEIATLETTTHTKLPDWAGIINRHIDQKNDCVIAQVYVSSPAWLFDELLAAGGAIRLTAPKHLVDAFRTYMQNLL